MALNLLDRIEQHYKNQLPFVAYRKPNDEQVRLILQNSPELHYLIDYGESGFVFAPFNLNEQSVLLRKDAFFTESIQIKERVRNSVPATVKEDDKVKDSHLKLVQKGIRAIKDGHLEKVVLARQVEVNTTKGPVELFQNILSLYPTAFCYLWFHPKVGMWLGATPEMFLEVKNQQLKTMSLAGTQEFKGENDPVWGSKELEEQHMVTQFIMDSLKNKLDSFTVSPTTSSRAGNLWHLKTAITGLISSTTELSDIIEALHPTPAVCGLPKITARDFILEHENYHRKFYTGFLGELNFKEEISRPEKRRNQEQRAYRTIKKKTSLYVNLRCMEKRDDRLTIYVGGGITGESDPELEWKETCDKSGTMLNIVLGQT